MGEEMLDGLLALVPTFAIMNVSALICRQNGIVVLNSLPQA
jgi:hypothetical protein